MDFIYTLILIILFLSFILNFKKIIIALLEFSTNLNYKLLTQLKTDVIKFGSIVYDEKGRFLEFFIENHRLLPHSRP
jgi:hypothetical protein